MIITSDRNYAVACFLIILRCKTLVDKINFMRYYENVEIAQSTKIQFIDKGGN